MISRHRLYDPLPKALCALALWMLIPTSVHAHHSYASFDMVTSHEIVGTVKKWAWTNPHVHLFVEVSGTDGASQQWVFESTSPSILGQRGVSKEILNVGDKIRIVYHPHRTNKTGGELQSVVLPDGKTVEVGMARDRTPVTPRP